MLQPTVHLSANAMEQSVQINEGFIVRHIFPMILRIVAKLGIKNMILGNSENTIDGKKRPKSTK